MTLARRVAIGFLSFLLFVSLSGFGLAFTVSRTVLNPDFIISRLDKLELAPLVYDLLLAQVPEEVTAIVPAELIEEALDSVLVDLEPWLREEAAKAIYTGYDYLLGRSQNLSLVVDVEPVKEAVRDKMRQTLLESPPAGLEMIPPDQLGRLFDQFYEQISEQIPTTLEVNESTLNELSPDIMPLLAQVRRYIGYFRIVYWALIVSSALFIMGIILLDRRVRGATRWIGIPCLVSGIVSYLGTFLVRSFATGLIASLALPTQLQAWLPQLLDDSLAPLRVYGIVLMVVGATLLIVSFVYRRRHDGQLPG